MQAQGSNLNSSLLRELSTGKSHDGGAAGVTVRKRRQKGGSGKVQKIVSDTLALQNGRLYTLFYTCFVKKNHSHFSLSELWQHSF